MKYRYGSRVGDSGSLLDMISYHSFCPDRNTKFPKIRMDPEVFRAPDRLPDQILRMTEEGCVKECFSLTQISTIQKPQLVTRNIYEKFQLVLPHIRWEMLNG